MAWFWFWILALTWVGIGIYYGVRTPGVRRNPKYELAKRSSTYLRDLVLALSTGDVNEVHTWMARVEGFDDSALGSYSSEGSFTKLNSASPIGLALPVGSRQNGEDAGLLSRYELKWLGDMFLANRHNGKFLLKKSYPSPLGNSNMAEMPILPRSVEEAQRINAIQMESMKGQLQREYQQNLQNHKISLDQQAAQQRQQNELDLERIKIDLERDQRLQKQQMELERLRNKESLSVQNEQMKMRINEEAPRVVAEAQKQERSLLHERWVNLLNMMGLALQTTVLVKTELRDHPLGQELVERLNHVYNEVRRIDPSAQMDQQKVVEAVERMMLRNMGLFDDDKIA